MSDSTEVGSIVAYLTLRREDWTAGVRSTEEDARRLGTLNPRIRIDANTGEILAQLGLVHAAERKIGSEASQAKPFVMNLWAALAAVAPAAAPIAAVAGGALLGLVPVAATVALGISGIAEEMKSGALQGTQYGQDIATVKSWLDQLKQTAASGLLSGVDQAVQQSQPLFAALNADIGQTSTQIGSIVGDAAPALLSILHQLEPLFSAVGDVVAQGAHALEQWAASGKGLTSFVTYIQAELPEVEHLLGGVITLVGHLFEGAAGPGAALLHDLNLLVDALDSIPVGVLATAIPLAISLYAALKTSQGVTAAVNGANAAMGTLGNTLGLTGPRAAAAATAQEAAAARVGAAVALEAEAYAENAARTVEALQAKQAEAARWGAAYDETVAQVAAAARVEATALAATATAAVNAAEEKIAAAEAAAAAQRESAVAGATSFGAALGPLAAIGVGVALFTTLLNDNSQAAQQAANAQNSYAESVKQSTDALAGVNVVQTNENLAKVGALRLLDELHQANFATGVSYGDLTKAVNGSDKQFASLTGQLKGTGAGGAILTKQLDTLRTGLHLSIAQQNDLNAANKQSAASATAHTAAVRAQAQGLGLSATAYLTAEQAAAKNADQLRQQIALMQQESNAAGLLNQALMTLAGQNLNVAQAQTSFGQSLHSVIDSMHKNGESIKGNSEKALANQQAIEGNVAAARQLAQAVAEQTHSNEKAATSYRASKKALEDDLAAHGKLTPAVKRYIDRLYDVKGISDYLAKHPTKVDLNSGPAEDKAARIQARINAIRQGLVPGIDADTTAGKRKLAELQGIIDALHGKTLSINTTVHRSDGTTTNPDKGPGRGYATGTGSGGLPDGWSWVGDPGPNSELIHKRGPHSDVYSHDESLQIAAQMGMNVPAYAGGTGSSSSKAAANKAASEHKALLSAAAALDSAAGNNAASAQSVRDAAHQLLAAAHAAGVSQKALAATAEDRHRLSVDAAKRQSVLARLGTAPSAPTAYERLAAAQDLFRSDRDKYASAAAGFDITGVTAPTPGPTTASRRVGAATITSTTPAAGPVSLSAAAIIGADAADLALVQEFDKLIHRLVAEGYDKDYVAQIASKGPAAINTARALAKGGPADVRRLNTLQKQRRGASNDIGTFLAKTYDQAGVDVAHALVKGLLSQEKALTSEMLRLVGRIDKKLKLEVPVNTRRAHGGDSGEQAGRHAVHAPIHVHAAPGHSASTIARLAANEVIWRFKR